MFNGTVNYPTGTSGDLTYTVEGLEIDAVDGLPVSYNASNLTTSSITGSINTLLSSSEFANATVTCTSTGNKSLTNPAAASRKLTLGTSASPLTFKVNSGSYTALTATHSLKVIIQIQLSTASAPVTSPPPTSGGGGDPEEIAYE